MESYDIYVELDALLDTRLGTLMRAEPKRTKKLMMDTRYYLRECDDFEPLVGIAKEDTDQLYRERDEETLKHTLMTPMMFTLRDIAHDLFRRSFIDLTMKQPTIIVNTYPYVLDESTVGELTSAIMSYVQLPIQISCRYLPLKDVTPGLIRSTYSGMIMYNFNAWLVHHVEAMKSICFPRVTIMAPKLYVDRPPKDPDEIKFDNPAITPWSIAREGYAPYFTLMFVPVSAYCIIPPPVLSNIIEESEDSSRLMKEAAQRYAERTQSSESSKPLSDNDGSAG